MLLCIHFRICACTCYIHVSSIVKEIVIYSVTTVYYKLQLDVQASERFITVLSAEKWFIKSKSVINPVLSRIIWILSSALNSLGWPCQFIEFRLSTHLNIYVSWLHAHIISLGVSLQAHDCSPVFICCCLPVWCCRLSFSAPLVFTPPDWVVYSKRFLAWSPARFRQSWHIAGWALKTPLACG